MHRFKFRVWDIKGSRFMPAAEYALMTLRFDGLPQFLAEPGLAAQGKVWPSELYTVEQFTGWKDRDGKEIYEGDILGRKGFIDIIVTWDDGRFLGVNKEFGSQIDMNSRSCRDLEVIGNIHES